MARSVWSGSISFGLVAIPVRLYTATRDHSIHFHQLDRRSHSRIEYSKVATSTGEKVEKDDIELGYDLGGGSYVTVEKSELEALRPTASDLVAVTDFVELDAIDPVFYERTYWVGTTGDAGARAYRLLLASMEAEKRVGIGSIVMRRKQYLTALRPMNGALALSTMRYADEVVDRSELSDVPEQQVSVDDRELELARQIVRTLSGEWDPERYVDSYTDLVHELLTSKEEGRTPLRVVPDRPAAMVDLLGALEASVDELKRSA